MSLRNKYALVRTTRAGRNINIDNCSTFVFNTSVEIRKRIDLFILR